MKAVKPIAIAFLLYVGMVAAFESMLGVFQPADQSTLTITTTDEDGTAHDRVLARLESGGQLFVAANHWPRAWYKRALANPSVQVALDGETGDYLVIPATEDEHDRVNGEHGLGIVFRILTGFPPRYFVRLEPRQSATLPSGSPELTEAVTIAHGPPNKLLARWPRSFLIF